MEAVTFILTQAVRRQPSLWYKAEVKNRLLLIPAVDQPNRFLLLLFFSSLRVTSVIGACCIASQEASNLVFHVRERGMSRGLDPPSGTRFKAQRGGRKSADEAEVISKNVNVLWHSQLIEHLCQQKYKENLETIAKYVYRKSCQFQTHTHISLLGKIRSRQLKCPQ